MSLGRFNTAGTKKPSPAALSEINMTPLVDVMLVLLVIFLVAAPLMLTSISLNLPKTVANGSAASAAVVRVELDSAGQIWLNQKATTLQDLRQLLAQAAQQDPTTELQLYADASVAYGRVVEIIGLAQKQGLTRIGFVAAHKP